MFLSTFFAADEHGFTRMFFEEQLFDNPSSCEYVASRNENYRKLSVNLIVNWFFARDKDDFRKIRE